jgi:hypothetical protein
LEAVKLVFSRGAATLRPQSIPGTTRNRPMRDKGKLVTWNDEKGYGFIAPSPAPRKSSSMPGLSATAHDVRSSMTS